MVLPRIGLLLLLVAEVVLVLADERRAVCRVCDGRGFACRRVDHRERLQKIVDLVAGYAELERVAVDLGVALVVGDAVAVDDDASERGVALDEGCRVAAPDEPEQRDRDEIFSHGFCDLV